MTWQLVPFRNARHHDRMGRSRLGRYRAALHAPQTIAALAAGKHVLCEKPTAMNPAQVEAMIAAGKAAGRHFGVAFYRRLFPAVARARELMRAGAIGRPTLVWACWHMWFDEQVL